MSTKPQLPERPSRAAGGPTALDGLLVVDFTRVVAGPACTQTLADFGARVIKIENPDGGDDTRAYEHAEIGGESAAYLSLNRNKSGIALDLAVPEAREIALDLIRRADVVVENFSSGVMKKFGLDYEAVAPLNPRLVYCSISAYGRTGPFASRPGFDPTRKARSENKELLRTAIAEVFANDTLENWMTKMKVANIPVGYLRTVEEGFNAPEARERARLSRIPHRTAEWVPNIEPPINMSVTAAVDPVAAPLLGEHTEDVMRETLGYDQNRIAALTKKGAFGLRKATTSD